MLFCLVALVTHPSGVSMLVLLAITRITSTPVGVHVKQLSSVVQCTHVCLHRHEKHVLWRNDTPNCSVFIDALPWGLANLVICETALTNEPGMYYR